MTPTAPHEVLLVLDATTGQNGLSQARLFDQAADLTGVVLTKLDGTARGGIVMAIRRELGIPVKLVGSGEKLEDLQPFDAQAFARAIFAPDARAPRPPAPPDGAAPAALGWSVGMFDALTDKLQGIFSGLKGRGTLTESDIDQAMRAIRLSLLEADVIPARREAADHAPSPPARRARRSWSRSPPTSRS